MASLDEHLPGDLLNDLERQEANRFDIVGARGALENALTHQFREISDGMVADALIHNQPLSGVTWWQQFLCRQDEPSRYAMDLKLPEFLAYRSRLAQRVASCQIRPLAPDQVANRKIRIYGGYCVMGDEGRINRQLAKLGSSCRLVVVGSARARSERAKMLIKRREPSGAVPFDGRFLFGPTEPISVWHGAAMFVFRREWALSPYMEPNAHGFTDDARIVVRVTPIRAEVEVKRTERQAAISRKEVAESQCEDWFDDQGNLASQESMIRDQVRTVIRHEGSHILYDDARISLGNSVFLTQKSIRHEDVLRYAATPRTVEEFRSVFCDENVEIESRTGMTQVEFDELFTFLCERGLLISRSAGQYESKLFRKGMTWEP